MDGQPPEFEIAGDNGPDDAEIHVADVHIDLTIGDDGATVVVASGTFAGVDFTGSGPTPRDALFDLFRQAFPDKKLKLTAQAAWNPLLREKGGRDGQR